MLYGPYFAHAEKVRTPTFFAPLGHVQEEITLRQNSWHYFVELEIEKKHRRRQ